MDFSDDILKSFSPITLAEMDQVRLLDRVDTKYAFSIHKLPGLLESLRQEYHVVEINGIRNSRYETLYFDSDDFRFYIQHHNGKLNRHKIRFRRYVDPDIAFFEIKFKNNKGRLIKDRVRMNRIEDSISGEAEMLLLRKTPYRSDMVHPVLQVFYNRITLVNKKLTERVTVDTGLRFQTSEDNTGYPFLVIAEVKQDASSGSPFMLLMHQHHIRKLSISKYCLGIASLYAHVKKNNFKAKLLNIHKICSHEQ